MKILILILFVIFLTTLTYSLTTIFDYRDKESLKKIDRDMSLSEDVPPMKINKTVNTSQNTDKKKKI